MAEQEPHSLASAFPNPPPFWKDFTPDKITRMEELSKNYMDTLLPGDISDPSAVIRVPDVPEDLIHLQPPAEPEDGQWRVYGDLYKLNDELPTLEDQGILNLPPTHPSRANNTATTTASAADPSSTAAITPSEIPYSDRALELKRLVKSLLLNFLELTGVLASTPSHAEAKIDDIRTLLINIHHALNEYRPHQARESAAEMMQEHLDRTRRETVAIRSQVDKARRVLEGLGSLSVPAALPVAPSTNEGGEGDWKTAQGDRDAELWKTMDVIFT